MLLSIKEAADKMNVAPRTIFSWIYHGKIPTVERFIGLRKRIFIDEARLEAAIEQRRKEKCRN